MAVYQESSGTFSETAAVGPLTEGAAGIAVIILAILGLAAILPGMLAAIAAIVIGVGLMIEGTNTAIEYSHSVSSRVASDQMPEAGGSITVEFLAGGAGIVLGILALIGAHTAILLSAAVIVFGAATLLAGATAPRVTTVALVDAPETALPRPASAARVDNPAARGLQVLIGLTAVVLGILAFVLPASGTALILVGLLVVGAALLATSASFTGMMVSMLSTR